MNDRLREPPSSPIDPEAPYGHGLSPMIEGPYAPVFEESVFDRLEIIGEIPADLNGVYLRNGPNARHAPQGRYHWFDGDGMLHGAHFDRGRLTYRNKWVRTDAFRREEEARRACYWGVMETHKDRPDKPIKDSANTDVIGHAGTAAVSWYLAGDVYRVHPVTLETLGKAGYTRGIHGAFSAHCKADEITGELFFFDYWNESPYMSYGVVGPDGKLRHQVPVQLPGPRLPHDMAITEHYTILHDMPLFYDEEALRAGRHKIAFHSELPARFGVIPRYGAADSIRWFEATPCYIYHVVNAWEEGDEVVMVGCRYMPPRDASGAIDTHRMAKMIALLQMDARLYRWRFNMKTGATREEMIDPDHNLEFPTYNTALTGRRTHWAWMMEMRPDIPHFTGVVRHNTDTGAIERWSDGEGVYYSEAPFGPRDNPRAEDDGYVVSFVWNDVLKRSEIQVFDAREIARGPVMRAIVPQRIPAGFHATWIQSKNIA